MQADENGTYVKHDDYAELEQKNAELVAALKKYGDHSVDCTAVTIGTSWGCDCGFEQAIAEAGGKQE